jgi:hypothetical protein
MKKNQAVDILDDVIGKQKKTNSEKLKVRQGLDKAIQ